MKRIDSYNSFLERKLAPEYSIYDWFEDLKRYQWGKSLPNKSNLKIWTNHFIGIGWFDKIEKHVDDMFKSLSKADINYIHDRMYDVYDNLPHDKEKFTKHAILYGDYKDYVKGNRYKFTGSIYLSELGDENKINVIIHILREMIYPTLFIGYSPSVQLRRGDKESYVSDVKYKCDVFNIDNYIVNDNPNIKKYEFDEKSKYSCDRVLSMYVPGVVINIGGYSDSINTGKMNIKKLEEDIDEVLPSILSTLDYEEVIFDCSRFDRKFDPNTDIYDYTLKILLKV